MATKIKVENVEVPHERAMCVAILLRYLEHMRKGDNVNYWYLQILKELNHII